MNIPVYINDFSGGMTGDDRSLPTATDERKSNLIKNFDPVSRKHRLTPYFDTQNGDASSSTHQITDFINYAGLTGTLYGLGNDATNVQLYTKDSLTSGSAWSTFANSTGSAGGLPLAGVFVQYHGFAYGGHASGGTIWKCDIGAGTAFVNTDTTLTNPPTAAVVHSKDDILYVGNGNLVAKNNAGSWTTTALSMPTGFSVTCLAEFNDYLAIGGNTNNGKSIVYLWDRHSTLDNMPGTLDWGFGTLNTLQQLEEYLVGVSIVGTSGLYPKMVFRKYLSGAGSEVFNEIFASSVSGLQVVKSSMKVANRMYFAGGITIDGTLHNGIFAIQRATGAREFSVWIDRLPNNDTAIATSSLKGFILINDYVFISYNDGGYVLRFTNSTATVYSSTSYFETTYNQGMKVQDRTKNKQLKVVAISTVPISVNGGQVTVDYKVDGGAWTALTANTTVGSVTTEYTKDATGTSFTAGREYKFRIKAGGLAGVGLVEPTELKYSYEILDTLI